MNIIKDIAQDISPEPGCMGFKNFLSAKPKDFIDVFFQNTDYCIENNFPNKRIKEKYLNGLIGFYYKKSANLINHTKIAGFDSNLKIRSDGHKVTEVFLRDCVAEITARESAFIIVWSINSNVKTTGNVRILER